MLKPSIFFLFLALFLATHSGFAISYWQCVAEDQEKKQWAELNIYERMAAGKAYEACKKASRLPKTCRISEEYCEYFKNGRSTRPLWRCTALDERAEIWRSRPYPRQDDAALAAKANCEKHSRVPATCYVRLIACQNLHDPS